MRNRNLLLIVLLALLPLQIFGQEANPPAQNRIEIEKDAQAVEYNRMIFGQFVEHFHRQIYGGIVPETGKTVARALLDRHGFRKDVIEALKELKIPIVRYPGGCFVSSYHWLDGVGSKRQPSYDKAWGVEDPNTFGTAEFVLWCKAIGAEPFICTNAGTGTPEEMSDWVEYCNLNIGKWGCMRIEHGYPEPFNVKYWSVGNENWGSHEIGAKTVAEWGLFVRESAKMMKQVDPSIKLFAAALPSEDWTLPLLQQAGQYLHYVSIHAYWDGNHEDNSLAPYLTCMMRTQQPAEQIEQTIRILEKANLRGKVKIAFDEWNLRGWLHPTFPCGGGADKNRIKDRDGNDVNSLYTMADAVFSACVLNTFIRHCKDVEIGGFSPVVNTRGALFVHSKGIVRRTTFHVLSMYANKLEKNYLPLDVKCEDLTSENSKTPVLDVVLTCDDAKKRFVLAAVNKSPDKAIDLELPFVPEKNAEITRLSGKSPDDYNDVGSENNVVPVKTSENLTGGKVTLPPHSVSLIELFIKADY